MSITRTKTKLVGFYCDSGFNYYSWGGTDYDLGLASHSFTDDAYLQTQLTMGTTTSTTETDIGSATFIYPCVHENVMLLDGTVIVYASVSTANSGAGYTYLDQINFELLRITSGGSITVVGSGYSRPSTFSISPKAGFPTILTVEDAEYEYDDHRIGLRISYTGHVTADTGTYYLYMDHSDEDLFIYIPYV